MKRLILFLTLISICFTYNIFAADMTYEPFGNTEQWISNVYFDDLYDISYLAQVQDCVGLGLMFSDGKEFNPKEILSNSDALRIIYRSAGKEAEGLAAAYNSELREAAGLGEYDENSWSDGFYMLALRDGLIDNSEFISAFTDVASPLARTGGISVDNFVRFMCKLHGVKTNGTISGYSFSDYYAGFYAAAYHNHIMSEQDLRLLEECELLSNELAAYILKKFESRILEKTGVKKVNGRVTSVEETEAAEGTERYVTVFSNNTEYVLESRESENGAFYAVRGDYPVLGYESAELSGCIRENDRVCVYLKDGKVLFVRVETPQKEAEETKMTVLRGNMYVHDYRKNEIVFDNVSVIDTNDKGIDGFVKIYLQPGTKYYYDGQEIDKYTINERFLDSSCTVFLRPFLNGSLERAYSLVFE